MNNAETLKWAVIVTIISMIWIIIASTQQY
jgi:hypothetical protein